MSFPTTNIGCNTGVPFTPVRYWSRVTPSCVTSVDRKTLDMRRKAEILKYNDNSSKMTKKQQYAALAKHGGPGKKKVWATQSETYTNPNTQNLPRGDGNTLICSQNKRKCAPTTASDVPGKVKKLCMEENVPLTRYRVQRTYRGGGEKWPQTAWRRGDKGFPVGKSGRLRFV
jgi:hypothetical protein